MYIITCLFLFLSYSHLNLAAVGDIESLDWIAAAPYTYDHTVGGGAYNTRAVGEYKDTVESLEGRQETCGDLVTYILAITMQPVVVDKENSVEFDLMFLADSTGQSGVALGELVHWRVNGPQKVENGNGGGTGPGVGAGQIAVDGFYKDNGTPATISGAEGHLRVVNGVTDVMFNQGAQYLVHFRVDGLNAGDQIPIALDIRLMCKPGATPTGNLQASLTAANLVTSKGKSAIPGGQQTVPFKTVSDIRGLTECAITDASGPIKGVNFTADVTITSDTMTNGGTAATDFYYSWTSGAYLISSSSTGTSQLHTFDLECTYLHSGEYLWSQGTCGCESTWIGNNQPQLFYDPLGNYYNAPTVVTLPNGIVTDKYTAVDSTKAVSELYLLHSDGKTIVRAVWTDGRTMDFTNVNYAPIPPSTFAAPAETCACKRRLDIALLIDKSSYINDITYPAEKAFALAFAQEFTISSSNAQFAIIEFADTTTTVLGINAGTTLTNVMSKISALVCKLVNKACGSAPPNIANAIDKAVIELKSSSRSLAATPVIVVVTIGWDTSGAQTSAIAASVKNARDQGIAVFAVIYSQDAKSFAMPAYLQVQAFGDPYYIINRFDANELTNIIPDDIAAKVCKLNTRPCGSLCCGVCDTACGTCLPVDTCSNSFPNCVNETVVSGSCCVTRVKADTCPYDAASCQFASCNAQSGSCVTVSTCQKPDGDNCYNYKCDNGKCIQTLNVPSTTTKCSTYSCKDNVVVPTPVNCGTPTKCVNYKCDDAKGGCYVEPILDPTPSTNPCIKRICDPATGWKDDPVQCPTTDLCFPNECVNGVCEFSPIVCNDPNNKCDTSKCDKGVCVNSQVQCTPDDLCSTAECNPATGSCVQKKKVCVATACADVVCNGKTGICEEVDTPGCIVGCDCTLPSTTCKKQRCDVGTTTCGTPIDIDCSALAPDYCSIASPCNDTNGCVYTNNDCSTALPQDDCHVVIRDPTNPECCVQKEKNCDGVDPCKSYKCDISQNGCVETYLCVDDPSNKCVTSTCTSTGCVSNTKQCTPPDPCYSATCDSSTGECNYVLKSCDDKDPCTTDACDAQTGECKYTPIDCNDKNVCTVDSCQAGSCAVETMDCDDGIDCTVDSCDPVNGCSHKPNDLVCKSTDPCVISICDEKNGCVESAATCPDTNLWCNIASCVAYQGCVIESRPCGENSTVPCTFYECDEDKDTCREEALVCGAAIDTTVLVGSVIGTAAIAGIVIAVVILAAGVTGGTAFAYYQSGADGEASSTANNPLYVDDGNSADNPLHHV